jgi:hypothetical protein
MSKPNYAFLNEVCDRIDALPVTMDQLTRVKVMVAEMIKHPDLTEAERIDLLASMEDGGYEALANMLANRKLPEGFDPANRPWNAN